MNEKDQLKNEVNRVRRVSDMLVSMHSMLRDEYSRKSTFIDCALFGSSIILVAVVFLDPSILNWIPISPTASKVLLGVFSILTFFISLVIYRVDWKYKSELHKYASEMHANIKLECQRILATYESISDIEIEKLHIEYRYLSKICVAVPDASFLRLKNKHQTKVAVSKYLSDNPGTSLFLLKMRIWFANIFKPGSSTPITKYAEFSSNNEEENC